MDLEQDFTFAAADGEIGGQAARLRYVAAINAGCSKKQFIAEAVKAGYNPATAAIQFVKSRGLSLLCGDVLLQADGSLIDNPDFDWRPAA